MHVLILPSWYPTTSLPVNGIFCQDQAQALARAGLKVGVVYPDLCSVREFSLGKLRERYFQTVFAEEEGVSTLRSYGWDLPFSRGWFKVNRTLRLLDLYINRFGRPDIVHAHCTLWAGVAARSAEKRFGLPYLITEHSSAFLRNRIKPWQIKRLRESLQGATRVMAVSWRLSDQINAYAGGQKLRIQVCPNMIDTDFFYPPRQLRHSKPFRILAVALLTPNKGVDLLVRAFARVFGRFDDVVLEIGGDGPQLEELRALAIGLGVAHRVSFLGMLTREEVRDAMWRANLLVCASDKETFGLVLLEAMATGLPVVATRSGGPEEFVQACNGLLIDPGDEEALGGGMLTVFNDYEKFRRRAGGELSRQTVLPFSEAVVVKKLIEQYQEILTAG